MPTSLEKKLKNNRQTIVMWHIQLKQSLKSLLRQKKHNNITGYIEARHIFNRLGTIILQKYHHHHPSDCNSSIMMVLHNYADKKYYYIKWLEGIITIR